MNAAWTTMPSPIGDLLLQTNGQVLTAISFHPFEPPSGDSEPTAPILVQARRQLDEYFMGQRSDFDVPLSASGTAFQQRVWEALRAIPYGRTASYGEIARRLQLPPGASRAVGVANGANPIPIMVPCHRVIGSDGSLTGYAGGLARKQRLLHLEIPGLF
ncbi:MAG: methylated-DNA--[protein]-cysteine S-methyltransferase [Nocardioidaceae bacterium]